MVKFELVKGAQAIATIKNSLMSYKNTLISPKWKFLAFCMKFSVIFFDVYFCKTDNISMS